MQPFSFFLIYLACFRRVFLFMFGIWYAYLLFYFFIYLYLALAIFTTAVACDSFRNDSTRPLSLYVPGNSPSSSKFLASSMYGSPDYENVKPRLSSSSALRKTLRPSSYCPPMFRSPTRHDKMESPVLLTPGCVFYPDKSPHQQQLFFPPVPSSNDQYLMPSNADNVSSYVTLPRASRRHRPDGESLRKRILTPDVDPKSYNTDLSVLTSPNKFTAQMENFEFQSITDHSYVNFPLVSASTNALYEGVKMRSADESSAYDNASQEKKRKKRYSLDNMAPYTLPRVKNKRRANTEKEDAFSSADSKNSSSGSKKIPKSARRMSGIFLGTWQSVKGAVKQIAATNNKEEKTSL